MFSYRSSFLGQLKNNHKQSCPLIVTASPHGIIFGKDPCLNPGFPRMRISPTEELCIFRILLRRWISKNWQIMDGSSDETHSQMAEVSINLLDSSFIFRSLKVSSLAMTFFIENCNKICAGR